jgi:hypothetical protein
MAIRIWLSFWITFPRWEGNRFLLNSGIGLTPPQDALKNVYCEYEEKPMRGIAFRETTAEAG